MTCWSVLVSEVHFLISTKMVKNQGPFPEEGLCFSARGKRLWPCCPSVRLDRFTLLFGFELASLLIHWVCFPSVFSWFPGVLEEIQGQLCCEHKTLEKDFGAYACWVAGCPGRVYWSMEKAFFLFFIPLSRRNFPASHKSRLCGSWSRMLVGPKWPQKLARWEENLAPVGVNEWKGRNKEQD